MKQYICILGFVLLSGCVPGCASCPEKAILREGMYRTSKPLLDDQKEWAEKLVVQPDGTDKRSELPQLTQDQFEQSKQLRQEYEDLINDDRSRTNGSAGNP